MNAVMSFNETLKLKNASTNSNEMENITMNEEKTLTRIDSEYEKVLAERNKLQAELDRLTKKETQEEHKLATMQNRYKEEKRRSRNHRLIERGAILESLIPNAESYTNGPMSILWTQKVEHFLSA